MTRDEEHKQSRRALLKNLIHPLPYRIVKASDSRDLLPHSPVYVDAWDEVDYGVGTNSERQNLNWFHVYAAVAEQGFI
jgi:hypothetical protein